MKHVLGLCVVVWVLVGGIGVVHADDSPEHSRTSITRSGDTERESRSRDTSEREEEDRQPDESGMVFNVEINNADGEVTVAYSDNSNGSNADITVTINGSVVTDNGNQDEDGGNGGVDGSEGVDGDDGVDEEDDEDASEDDVSAEEPEYRYDRPDRDTDRERTTR